MAITAGAIGLYGATIGIQKVEQSIKTTQSKTAVFKSAGVKINQAEYQQQVQTDTQNKQLQTQIDQLKSDLQSKADTKKAAELAQKQNALAALVVPKAEAASAPMHVAGSHEDWLAAAGIPQQYWGYAEYIIAHEDGSWCPTISFGVSAANGCPASGNTGIAYGIPQANPGYKMASAGSDWKTNPITQLRWMASYVTSRYGGWYGAYVWKVAHGTY